MTNFRSLFRRFVHILSDFGFQPFKFFQALRGIPPYITDFVTFYSRYSGQINILPSLRDRYEAAGAIHSEYFLQDLFVAQQIQFSDSSSILDMGSRLDGFVSHIATHRPLDVIDVRPLPSNIYNVNFVCLDISSPFPREFFKSSSLNFDNYDVITCLHALEHVGLGRYGDRLDPFAYKQALKNLISLLDTNGTFWLSIPTGKPRIEFNSHQIFSFDNIQSSLSELNAYISRAFVVNSSKSIVSEISLAEANSLSLFDYSLCIYEIKHL